MALKVLHVVTRLDLGGAQLNTLYTAEHLDPARFDVRVVSGPSGFFDAQIQAGSLRSKTIFIDRLRREIAPIDDIRSLFALYRLFLDTRPQIVHTHSSKAGILGRVAAWWAKVPVIIHTYHGFGFHDRQSRATHLLFRCLEWLCARITTQPIFVSQANIDYAQRHGLLPHANPQLIRSGIKFADFPCALAIAQRDQLKMSVGIGRHKKLVLSVGNLKPQKNAGDFVAAAALVLKRLPDTRFVFIGDGPQRPQLQAKAFALGLNDRLFFLGWRRDVPAWLAAADVFTLTSLWEGLPRALVEAMKSGLPSVCYATDGVVDVLQDAKNGYAVTPQDVQACADRIVQILSDDALRKRLGQAAAAAITDDFDIDQMVLRQEDLYLRLSEQSPRKMK